MMRSSALLFLAHACALGAAIADHEVSEIVHRLRVLAAKESVWPRIDTDLRASVLLKDIQPAIAAGFREEAIALLLAHKDLPATPTIADNLKTLAPARLPEILRSRPAAKASAPAPAASAEALGQFLEAIEHGVENPDDYTLVAGIRRQYGFTVGSDNASVRARDALADLAELVRTDYDFSLSTLHGPPVTLRAQRGKVVLLTFLATWCGPCLAEMPLLEKLHREQPAVELVVLAISDERRETVEQFVHQTGYTFPILLDPGRAVFNHYKVETLPAARVVDKTGRLRAEFTQVDEPGLLNLLRDAGLLN
jgi:peroxiredoxin